ncbi:MAG: PAS domain S-box protein [Deltaproteobacteria bacterium]|nr:PAS domain S-box protein [Deltaproteobacteria bacterium]MBW2594552.1 PAS domain S-box protein [Deltaproteobacteria bacterium]MBW2649616.1 PAS domain S-box protein [Deltaproteobacteria bacterium]
MKITHKLMLGYLIMSVLIICAGYLYIKIYNDIKLNVIKLNKYSLVESEASDEVLLVMERCQESVQDLVNKKYRIIYTFPDKRQQRDVFDLEQKNIKSNLQRLEHFLSATIEPNLTDIPLKGKGEIRRADYINDEDLQRWVSLRKRDFYYHWKYLSHFINLSDKVPNQAYDFFKKTLEPHYRKNIYPVINRYREKTHEDMEIHLSKIIDESIPNATLMIIALTMGTIFTVVIMGYWISRSVSRPINRLATAALEIGRGQLDTQIDITSSDEVGVLTNAFNEMAHNLGKTTVSKSYVDNIIKSMLDTLIVINPRGEIIKVNQSALNLLGYERDDLVGKSIQEIIPEEASTGDSVIDGLVSTGAVVNMEKTYLTKNGKRIPVLFSGAVMKNDSGDIQGIVCVARDIIERKKSEMALQKAHHELEKRVKERTADLSKAKDNLLMEIDERKRIEDALRDSRNELRVLSSHILTAQEKERKKLSYELHDDLGQSLSLLKMQISFIKRNLSGDQTKLITECNEMLGCIDSVIENVRRISRDLSPSILEDIGLSAAIQRLIDDFIKYYNIDADIDIEKIDEFFSSEQQIIIYRIFQEILTNIDKHAEASRASIIIKNVDGSIFFTVKDNGKGFKTRRHSGKYSSKKGIGLAAMQERARMLGSSFNIGSKEGMGTEITFTVPIDGEVNQ